MPVEDRAADAWEPLVAVADAVGGHWPTMARETCRALVAAADSADEDKALGVKLLVDIRQVLAEKNVPFLPSTELVTELRRIEESPWDEVELNPSKLAYRLWEFGVKPRRSPAANVRGYALEAFSDALRGTPVRTRQRCQNPRSSTTFDLTGLTRLTGQGVSLTGQGVRRNLPVRRKPLPVHVGVTRLA